MNHDSGRIPARFVLGLQVLGCAGAYYGASRLGLMGSAIGGISPFWPATGVAVAALLVFGIRVWPGITLGSLPIDLSLAPVLPALGSTVADTLAPVCAYLLLRWVSFRPELDRIRDALALVLLGAFAAMLVSSSLGTTIMLLSGQIPSHRFGLTWLVYWTGDAMGVLTVAPLLLALRTLPRLRALPLSAWAEIGLMLPISFFVAFIGIHQPNYLYLAFLAIAWAALRYQLIAVAPSAFIISWVAVDAAAHGIGPFAGEDVMQRMLELQLFNGSLVLGGLFLAVLITQRDNARFEIERTCRRLGEVIKHIDQREGTDQVEGAPYVKEARESYRVLRDKSQSNRPT